MREKTFSGSKKYPLNKRELMYVKLYAYGYEQDEIQALLNLNDDYIFLIKRAIEDVFQTKDWYQIIKRCFANKILNKYDYLNESIKEQANQLAKSIFENFMDTPKGTNRDNRVDLSGQLYNFLKKCADSERISNEIDEFEYL